MSLVGWLLIGVLVLACLLIVVGAFAFPPGTPGPKYVPQHRPRPESPEG